jgi:hypothetical protein
MEDKRESLPFQKAKSPPLFGQDTKRESGKVFT